MQAVTEQSAFGHGEKATLVIPPSDILAFLEIERSWDATLPRESNSNPHKFTLVGNPDWRGRSDTELEETLADQDLLRSDRPAALAAGRAALVELRTYLAELQNGVVVYDTPTAGSTAESLALPPGSTAIAAKARQGKRAQLEHLHSRTNARFRVHYNTIFGQELYVVGDVPELGAWNPRFGVRMTWMGGGNWEAVVSLNNRIGNREAQYKYVVVQPGNPDKWEGGGNRTIRLGASGATTDYDDRWQV
jgi:hypothetical protein